METKDIQSLENRVMAKWNEGHVDDMQDAFDMAIDALGEDFRDFLTGNGYEGVDEVNDDIDDDIDDLSREIAEDQADGLDSYSLEEKRDDLVDKKDDIEMDGGPLWDIANGPDEAENVFISDFIDLIEDYVHGNI